MPFVELQTREPICASPSGALSDLNFWSLSRESKVIGLVSTQSISSIKAVLGGKEALVNTVLANFRQKIFFRTDEPQVIEHMSRMTGNTDVLRNSYSQNHGESKSNMNLFEKQNQISSSTTETQQERKVIDSNLIQSLGDKAICFFDINGRAASDVIILTPLYPKEL